MKVLKVQDGAAVSLAAGDLRREQNPRQLGAVMLANGMRPVASLLITSLIISSSVAPINRRFACGCCASSRCLVLFLFVQYHSRICERQAVFGEGDSCHVRLWTRTETI